MAKQKRIEKFKESCEKIVSELRENKTLFREKVLEKRTLNKTQINEKKDNMEIFSKFISKENMESILNKIINKNK